MTKDDKRVTEDTLNEDRYSVAVSTLQGWEKRGLVRALRSPGGKRLYDVASVAQALPKPSASSPTPTLSQAADPLRPCQLPQATAGW